MAEQHETRIVSRPRPDGMVEISVYLPGDGREHRTGMAVPPSQEEKTVRQLKETFEKAGNRVTFKEM